MIGRLISVWEHGTGGSVALVLTLILTAAFVLAFALGQTILARVFTQLAKLGVRGTPRIQLQLRKLMATLQVALSGGLFIFLSLFFVPGVLRLYPSTRGLALDWNGILAEKARGAFNAVVEYLPSLLFLVVLSIVTRVVLGLLKQVFLSVEAGQIKWTGFEPDWAPPTFQLLRIAVVFFAVVIAFPYLPASDTEAFKSLGVFAGVLLSFGTSGAVANATAGLALTYEKAFREGDYVVVAGQEGVVERIGVLTTRVRTLKNECLLIPNQNILSATVVNYNFFEEGVAITASATIGYEVSWRKVHEILRDAARQFRERTEIVHSSKEPRILQTALNDFHVGYSVEVFVRELSDRRFAETALHECVRDAFDRGGVLILSPAHAAVHLEKEATLGDAEQKVSVFTPHQ